MCQNARRLATCDSLYCIDADELATTCYVRAGLRVEGGQPGVTNQTITAMPDAASHDDGLLDV